MPKQKQKPNPKQNKPGKIKVVNHEKCWNSLKAYIKLSMLSARQRDPNIKDVITPVMLDLEEQNSEEVTIQ